MALALKLGADGQLQQLQDGDSLVADAFNRISSSGDLVIGGNVTGGAEEVTIGATTSVVHVLGDTELDGFVEVAEYVEFADMTAPANPGAGLGRLYKKTGDDGVFWLPDAGGAEVDLTDTGTGIPVENAIVQLRRTTGFSFPTSWGDVTMDTTDEESDAAVLEHDNTNTARLVFKRAGNYRISFELEFNSLTTETMEARLFLNGTTAVPGSNTKHSDITSISIIHMGRSVVVSVAADDYVTLQVQNTTTGGAVDSGCTLIANALQGAGGGGDEFADNVFRIQDNGDATKEIAFEASLILTATTRTITVPDSDLTLLVPAGLAGGQSIVGGTASGEDLTLESTSDGTKGSIILAAGTNLDLSDEDIINAKTITFGEPVSQTTSGSTLTIDCSAGNKHRITLASNITTIVLTNAIGATNITLEFIQNGTGSFTVTGWPTRVRWQLNVEPVFGDGANALRLVSFYWNGPTFDDYIGEFNSDTYS